jgi:hypothetical protein
MHWENVGNPFEFAINSFEAAILLDKVSNLNLYILIPR